MVAIVVNMKKEKYETDAVCDIFFKIYLSLTSGFEPKQSEPELHLAAAPAPTRHSGMSPYGRFMQLGSRHR
jgi:hypothetical protein